MLIKGGGGLNMHNFTSTIGEICYNTKSDGLFSKECSSSLIISVLEYRHNNPFVHNAFNGSPPTYQWQKRSKASPIHQHWFLHTCNISHPAFIIFRFTRWAPIEKGWTMLSPGFETTATQTFSCDWHELDWGGRLSKLWRTMLGGLLPSSFAPLYKDKISNCLDSEAADFQNSQEQCLLSCVPLYVSVVADFQLCGSRLSKLLRTMLAGLLPSCFALHLFISNSLNCLDSEVGGFQKLLSTMLDSRLVASL